MDVENYNPQFGDEKALEEVFQKKSPLEHILLRPDTYIGSIEAETQNLWVFEDETSKMVQRNVTYVPGLYKIFDEILVNAADNKQRDAGMDKLEVFIDEEEGSIRVWNNGQGIPVEIHKVEQVYIPEMIFGQLLTSSNYNDNQKKTVGGRNGYGAKLANIFSTEFIVETCDSKRQKVYKQVWTGNMKNKSEPIVKKKSAVDIDFTCITFKPDFERFGMIGFTNDILALFKKRVYDIAGTTPRGLKVFLNGQRLKVNSFRDYVDMYFPSSEDEKGPEKVFEKVNDRWEVCVTSSDGSFQQVSFVNNICTIKGGTHVEYVSKIITDNLLEHFQKKFKKVALTKPMIKNHLFVFVNCLIENPAFDSQTKVSLTLQKQKFGSDCPLSEGFFKDVAKSPIVNNVVEFAQFKQNKDLKKTDGKKNKRVCGIAKLEDANWAGTKNSEHCTLILTEGDSAKALAVSGLSVVGRDRFGVFPLKGKVLNVREASSKAINNNEEIAALKQILGLKQGVEYENTKPLRYGHVMLMTDQDHDGSHIKGLIINLFQCFWPSLLKIPGFLVEFITPIVKCTKGKQVISFFTIPEYEEWKAENNNGKGWNIKYYKGLGTNTASEGKEYFSNLDRHVIDFRHEGAECDNVVKMAFDKKGADARKQWIKDFEPGTFLDMNVDSISYQEFVNKELILFSIASNQRAIPSIMDGLKPGQRKILYGCFKMNSKKEIKVDQLAGYVGRHSAYHHGEASLTGTIVSMAQNFVGSNNINLLYPNGQFGTRHAGGKDSASPRYIFTFLNPVTRTLFHPADDDILKHLDDDGQIVEPEWYCPIIPMILVNGSSGIGTGWSSSIPNYNPLDLVKNIKHLMAGEPQEELTPWYNGFTGTIQKNKSNYKVVGAAEVMDDVTVKITELPIGKWTVDYKLFLEEMLTAGAIEDIREYHTDSRVEFQVTMAPEKLAAAVEEGLENKFKLETKISTANMVVFDAEGRLRKWDCAEKILEEFYYVRLEYYQKRKDHLVDVLKVELEKLTNKVRFILAVISGELVISKRKKIEIVQDLLRQKYTPFPKQSKKSLDEEEEEKEDEDVKSEVDAKAADFDYLLSMPLWSLTFERVENMMDEKQKKQDELSKLLNTDIKQIWNEDLVRFEEALEDYLAKEAEREADGAARIKAGAKAGGKKKAAKVAKPKKKMDDDDDWAVEKEKPKTQSSRPALAPLGSTSVSASFSAMSKSVSKPTNPPTVTSSMSIKPSPLTLVVSEKKGSPVKQAKKAAPKNVKDRFATSKKQTTLTEAFANIPTKKSKNIEDDEYASDAEDAKVEDGSASLPASPVKTPKPKRNRVVKSYAEDDRSDDEEDLDDDDLEIDESEASDFDPEEDDDDDDDWEDGTPVKKTKKAKTTKAANTTKMSKVTATKSFKTKVANQDTKLQTVTKAKSTDFAVVASKTVASKKVVSPASSPEKDTVDAVDNDDDEPEYIPSPVKSKKSAPTSKQATKAEKPKKPRATKAKPAEKPSKPKTATKRSHAAMQSKASSSVSPLKKKAKKAKNDDDYEDEEGDKSLDDSEILSHSPVARPRRAAQKQVSYKEESEAEDEDDGDDGGLLEESDASDYED